MIVSMYPPGASFELVSCRSRTLVLLPVACREGVDDLVDLVRYFGLPLVCWLVLQALVVRQAACRLFYAAFALIDVLVSHA